VVSPLPRRPPGITRLASLMREIRLALRFAIW
jgi:hypothetical protein